MDYISLIQNRKSARGFTDEIVTDAQFKEIRTFFETKCKRLFPEIRTELALFGHTARRGMLNAAGYEMNMIGAPAYMLILTEKKEGAIINATYMMEDMVLRLMEMGLGSCYITFANGDHIKGTLELDTDLEVAAIIAFGQEARLAKRLRFNFKTMANIGIKEKRHYFDPKKKIDEMVFANTWGNAVDLDEQVGFYDDILWEAFYAASLSPSYLNRQPYGFVLNGGKVTLVSIPDEFTDPISEEQGLGIIMLHFEAAAEQQAGHPFEWTMGADAEGLALPEGYKAIATITV